MKIKLLFTALLLMSFMESAFSQAYIPMLDSSWNLAIASFGGVRNSIINPGINVVIGSNTYKKFMDGSIEVFLREDNITRKVYRRVNNVDQLLYDFSLGNGSSVTLSNGYTYTVTVSTVNVNGGTRKKLSLYHVVLPNETWIEGVGSSNHPLKPYYEMPSDPYVYLTCSSQNGINIYNHGIANGQPTPTNCSMLSIGELFTSRKINFYPNPFKTVLTISTESTFENATLKIFNSIGQLVKEDKNLNGKQFTITRDNIASGIYFSQLFEAEKLLVSTKLVITD